MFPDLNVITFDGNSVAIYKAALYIVTQLPNETVTVMVQECPADSESLVSDSSFISERGCITEKPKLTVLVNMKRSTF